MRLSAVVTAVSLIACHSPTEPTLGGSGASSWSALYAAGPVLVWRQPVAGWASIPADASLNAALYGVAVRGETGQTVSVEYEVECEGLQVDFDARVGSPATADSNPATVSLVIVQAGTDFVYDQARYYAISRARLACGGGRVEAVLRPENWNGVRGGGDSRAFAETIAAIGGVGVTFGGQTFAGHGVTMQSGQAKVRLVSWEVR